jgi:pyruvate/2-oxoglutarate dehydrogenase complex dihydrolipoamide dehydrogenase (E3) component|tara:strand:+ start:152 stop:448 length:297 start_codon:yes stop_codon:yes gene_type:complete
MSRYTLTEDDRFFVESVLAMAQQIVDAQYDEDVADDLQTLLVEVANMFDITSSKANVVEHEDGSLTVSFEEQDKPEKKKKNPFTVINGSKPDTDDSIH